MCLTATLFPVTIEAGIIRGCFTAHEGMPFNLRPAELDKVATRQLVAKHPVVFPSLIQAFPILVLDPLPGLVWVTELRPPEGSGKHPVIELREGSR